MSSPMKPLLPLAVGLALGGLAGPPHPAPAPGEPQPPSPAAAADPPAEGGVREAGPHPPGFYRQRLPTNSRPPSPPSPAMRRSSGRGW